MIKKLLELRKKMKLKKPSFVRQDANKHIKLGTAWRARKGRHNKYRVRKKGSNPSPSYGSPAIVRGLHASGRKEVMIYKVSDIDSVDKDTEAARISASVGLKKRIDIIKHAEKQKVRVLNPGVHTLKAISDASRKKSVKAAAKKQDVTKEDVPVDKKAGAKKAKTEDKSKTKK
ncbi:MAG: 50S ribosomal protein L32e [Candidatus Aenigmarchaeota archaeon]|nr:50S ribosomal protein L32e [Candidatus Aenigmarchaeota archaeon]MCK5043077.1 50S ribosomal protein L32e [Candidatus Aenigmarchaeota archaeon]